MRRSVLSLSLSLSLSLLVACSGGDDDGAGAGVDAAVDAAAADPAIDLRCAAPVIASQPVALEGGESPAIRFQVPDGATGIGLTVVGEPDETYWPCYWRSAVELVPAGWREEDANLGGRCASCALRMQQSEQVFAAAVPSGPDSPVMPGEHELAVCGESITGPSAATVEVTVHVKAGDGGGTGRLDLDLYFTGAQGWTAAGAADNAELSLVLDDVRTIY